MEQNKKKKLIIAGIFTGGLLLAGIATFTFVSARSSLENSMAEKKTVEDVVKPTKSAEKPKKEEVKKEEPKKEEVKEVDQDKPPVIKTHEGLHEIFYQAYPRVKEPVFFKDESDNLVKIFATYSLHWMKCERDYNNKAYNGEVSIGHGVQGVENTGLFLKSTSDSLKKLISETKNASAKKRAEELLAIVNQTSAEAMSTVEIMKGSSVGKAMFKQSVFGFGIDSAVDKLDSFNKSLGGDNDSELTLWIACIDHQFKEYNQML